MYYLTSRMAAKASTALKINDMPDPSTHYLYMGNKKINEIQTEE